MCMKKYEEYFLAPYLSIMYNNKKIVYKKV